MIKSQYSTVAWMTKNILVISFHEIEIKCVFNLEHDICIYCWNHLHENIIKKIMKLKVAHQKKNDWWMTFIECRAKKKDNEELDNHEKREEL